MDSNLTPSILWIKPRDPSSSKALVWNKHLGWYWQMLTSGYLQIILHPFTMAAHFFLTTMSAHNLSLEIGLYWILHKRFLKNNLSHSQNTLRYREYTYKITFRRSESKRARREISSSTVHDLLLLLLLNGKLLLMISPPIHLWAC